MELKRIDVSPCQDAGKVKKSIPDTFVVLEKYISALNPIGQLNTEMMRTNY